MKDKLLFLLFITLTLTMLLCTKDQSLSPDDTDKKDSKELEETEEPEDSTDSTADYDMLPKDKLPWPHMKPGLTEAQFNSLVDNLWIMDNFASYHASEDGQYLYFHSGLDIMLNDGTPIYAVDSGYVKLTSGEGTNYGYISIGDTEGEEYGNAWGYSHIINHQVQKGDFVEQGSHIGNVTMSHIHLSRFRLVEGRWDNFYDFEYLHPDSFFVYIDTEPPIIDTPFYYFKNNSNECFTSGDPPIVSGDVDIVVKMKDISEPVLNSDYGYMLRWCITRIEYEISGNSIQPFIRKSWDFTKIILQRWTGVHTVYKYWYLPLFGNQGTYPEKAYYIITNTDGTGEFGYIYKDWEKYAWNTAATDASGHPRFPNGTYTVKVTAYDYLGNSTTAVDEVVVNNESTSVY